nr:HAD family hydrolase [Blautia wexlerae]
MWAHWQIKCKYRSGDKKVNRKAVFFDADGTLCDMEKGVPQSTKEALKKLRENGHEAWLCTGRSRAFVSWYLEELPFTGMISACGATIEKDGERLFNKEMTPEIAKKSVEILRRYGLVPVMEGADFMYYDKDEYNTDVNWYTDLITESLGPKWRPIKGNEDCMHINKISAKMIKGCDAEAACRELSKYYDIIRHESGSGIAGTTIELVPKGFNKAVGISAVCRLFDISWEDTIVFGDSNNDLAMFEYAAVKVAMGNGSEKIKALADHITQDMFHYGIRNGLEYLKLI